MAICNKHKSRLIESVGNDYSTNPPIYRAILICPKCEDDRRFKENQKKALQDFIDNFKTKAK